MKQFAGYLQAVDPYDHPITVHNMGNPDTTWTAFLGDSRFSLTSLQYINSTAGGGAEVEEWRARSAAAGRPHPDLAGRAPLDHDDEHRRPAARDPLADAPLRRPAGVVHRRRGPVARGLPAVWIAVDYTAMRRKFVEQNLPFWGMVPADWMLTGEAGRGQVFAKAGEVYALYLPSGGGGSLNLGGRAGSFTLRWYNPRTGVFAGSARTVQGGGSVSLGSPPDTQTSDWAVLVKRQPTSTASIDLQQGNVLQPTSLSAASHDQAVRGRDAARMAVGCLGRCGEFRGGGAAVREPAAHGFAAGWRGSARARASPGGRGALRALPGRRRREPGDLTRLRIPRAGSCR